MHNFRQLASVLLGCCGFWGCGGPAPEWQQPEALSTLSPVCSAVVSYHQKVARALLGEADFDEEDLGDERIALQNALVTHPLTSIWISGVESHLQFRATEWAVAAFSTDEDARFHWLHLRRQPERAFQVASLVDAEAQALFEQAQAEAAQFFGEAQAEQMTVHSVCGGPWESVRVGESDLFVDWAWYVSQPIEKTKISMKKTLSEAAWMKAFRQWVQPYWSSSLQFSEPVVQFLVEALESGLGEYAVLRTLTEDEASEAQERAVFSLLEAHYAQWRQNSAEARALGLWESRTAEFWSRWVALPVALMMSRLAKYYGEAMLVDLLRQDPSALFVAYQDMCNRLLSWPRLPVDLVEDVQRMWRGN